MRKKIFLPYFVFIFLVSCSTSTQQTLTDEIIFSGESRHWKVQYFFNPAIYKEKKVSWVEMQLKDSEIEEDDLKDIYIVLESRDGSIKGHLKDMKTKINGRIVSFLVGTVNTETFKKDKYKLRIKYKKEIDEINLQNK